MRYRQLGGMWLPGARKVSTKLIGGCLLVAIGACSLVVNSDLIENGPADASVVVDSGPVLADASAIDAAVCIGVDLSKSPEHCGVCGHDCGGGICDSGRCQPLVLAKVASAWYLQADDSYVYVSQKMSGGGIVRIPRTQRTLLPAQQLLTTASGVYDLKVSGETVYFSYESDSTAHIGSVAKAGGTVVNVNFASPEGAYLEIIARKDSLVATSNPNSAGRVSRLSLDGGAALSFVKFASGSFAEPLVDDGSAFYFGVQTASASSITRVDDGSGFPGTIISDRYARRLVVDGAYVYGIGWETTIFRIPKAGGTAEDLTSASNFHVAGLAVDDQFVYYAPESSGVIFRSSKTAKGVPEVFASVSGTIPSLFVDNKFVYWTSNTTGEVVRLAK